MDCTWPREVNCEQMQALFTNTSQALGMAGRSSERLGGRVLQVPKGLRVMSGRGEPRLEHVDALLQGFSQEIKDVRGSARSERCETEFRCSRCIREGGVRLQ